MFDHGFVGTCFNSNRLLDQSVKELATVTAGSSIEPKRILVEVVIKMFMANSSLVRTHHPSLEQRSYSVATGQQTVTHISFFTDYIMNVADTVQAIVPLPSVGTNRASRLYAFSNSIFQAFC